MVFNLIVFVKSFRTVFADGEAEHDGRAIERKEEEA